MTIQAWVFLILAVILLVLLAGLAVAAARIRHQLDKAEDALHSMTIDRNNLRDRNRLLTTHTLRHEVYDRHHDPRESVPDDSEQTLAGTYAMVKALDEHRNGPWSGDCRCHIGAQACPVHPDHLYTDEQKVQFGKDWNARVETNDTGPFNVGVVGELEDAIPAQQVTNVLQGKPMPEFKIRRELAEEGDPGS